MPRIVADLGNSRLKWGRLGPGGGLEATVALPTDEPDSWARAWEDWRLGDGDATWSVASVNPPLASRLERFLAGQGVESIRWHRSAAEVSVRHELDHPETAGADRALAVVGALGLREGRGPGLVVSCGTAATVERGLERWDLARRGDRAGAQADGESVAPADGPVARGRPSRGTRTLRPIDPPRARIRRLLGADRGHSRTADASGHRPLAPSLADLDGRRCPDSRPLDRLAWFGDRPAPGPGRASAGKIRASVGHDNRLGSWSASPGASRQRLDGLGPGGRRDGPRLGARGAGRGGLRVPAGSRRIAGELPEGSPPGRPGRVGARG